MKDLKKYIQDQILEIDIKSIIEKEVKKSIEKEIHGDVKRQIQKFIENRIKEIIDLEIDIVLQNPIETDDGWGKKEIYPSFENLFKKKFIEKLNSNYEIKSTIDKSVKAKVEELYKESGKDFMNAFKEYLNKTIK